MGALPPPADWSKDLQTQLGGRLRSIEAAIESLKTARSIVATSAETEIANSDAFFVGTYGEAAFTDVYVPKGYSQCYILMAVDAGQTVTGGGGGNVGVQPRIKPSTTGVYIRGSARANGTPTNGPVSVSVSYATLVTGLENGSTLRLAVWCANTGSVVTQTCNVHLSASLLFLR